MEKLIEYCKQRYDEELGFKFSLSNIFAWLFFVVATYIATNKISDSVICGLSGVKVKAMMDMTDGVIPSLSMLQLTYSIAFVIGVAWLARSLAEGLFYFFTLKDEVKDLVVDITLKYIETKSNELQKKALGLGAKIELDRNIKKIRRSGSLAEVFLVVGLSTALLMPFTIINVGVMLVSAISFTIITWSSFSYFISSVLPYHVAVKYSAGELVAIKTSHSETLGQ